MHVYDPATQGFKDDVIHSVYLFESDDDLVETGWEQEESFGDDGVVFAVKVVAGDYIPSDRHPTPFLNVGTDHTLKIERNPNGGAPSRFEFTIDTDQWGFFTQPNMQNGGAVVAGAENFDSCEDFRAHTWDLDRQLSPGGSYSTWGTPIVVSQDHTKWWRNEGAYPPEWWIKHCPNDPNCADQM
jgi:hypothetical protein